MSYEVHRNSVWLSFVSWWDCFEVFILSKAKLISRIKFFFKIHFLVLPLNYALKKILLKIITMYTVKHFLLASFVQCAKKNYVLSINAHLWSVEFFSDVLECVSKFLYHCLDYSLSILRTYDRELRPNTNFSKRCFCSFSP